MSTSGPGRSYRSGLTVIELFDMFPDEESARIWFEETRWPDGRVICPRCEETEGSAVKSGNPMPWHCHSCKKYFSVKLGTVMESSRLPLRKWVVGLYLMTTSLKGVSSMKLHRDMGITQKSAWFMAQRIREGWMGGSGELSSGEIEVDETYIGGSEKSKHQSRRSGIHGPSGRAVVVGARERGGEIRAQRIERTDSRTLHGFVAKNVRPGSMVYTDEHRSYRRMANVRHRAVRHTARASMWTGRRMSMAWSRSGAC